MSKKLNKKTSKKPSRSEILTLLRGLLTEELSTCKVGKDFAFWSSTEKWGWKFAYTAETYFPRFITGGTLWSILVHFVSEASFPFKEKDVSFLKDYLSTQEFRDLSSSIMAYVERPRVCDFYVPIGGTFNREIETDDEIKISHDISLVCPSEGSDLLTLNIARGAPANLWLLSDLARNPAFHTNQVFLKVKGGGLIFNSANDMAVEIVLPKIKAALYAAYLSGVLVTDWEKRLVQLTTLDYGPTRRGKAQAIRIELPTGLSNLISKFRYVQSQTPEKKNDLLASTILGGGYSDFSYRYNNLRCVFDKLNKKDAEHITTSLEWAFESLSAEHENESVSFILMCIAIEALLGDGEQREDLTNILANRIAYFFGGTQQKRRQYIETFKEIYKARSHLVHGRKQSLPPEQKHLLVTGRNMLNFALNKELSELAQEKSRIGFAKAVNKKKTSEISKPKNG